MRMRLFIRFADDVDPEKALNCVATVIAGGRVSGDGIHFCWVTKFHSGITVVTNRKKSQSAADSFTVYKTREADCE